MNESNPRATSRRPIVLLALGAGVGIVLAGVGLVSGGSADRRVLPADAVARVNGEMIRRDDFERLVAAVASDRRGEIDEAERRRLLDRLIDEELLVQRGLELGLARNDRKVRADLTASVIASVVSEVEDLAPSDEELTAFYEQNSDFFTRPGRARVEQIFFRVVNATDAPPARERAEAAARRLRAGEPFAQVKQELGERELAPLPDALLPLTKLRDYVGLTAVRAIESLAVGQVSDPIRSGTGYHLLRVAERQADEAPPLEEIESQVRAELRRRAGDEALRSYLDELRTRASVAVAPALP